MNKTDNVAKTTTTRRYRKRIGQTTYRVGIHFNNESQETLDDKIIRLVRNEAADLKGRCGKK